MYGEINIKEALNVTKYLEFEVKDASNKLKIKQTNLPLNREILLDDSKQHTNIKITYYFK